MDCIPRRNLHTGLGCLTSRRCIARTPPLLTPPAGAVPLQGLAPPPRCRLDSRTLRLPHCHTRRRLVAARWLFAACRFPFPYPGGLPGGLPVPRGTRFSWTTLWVRLRLLDIPVGPQAAFAPYFYPPASSLVVVAVGRCAAAFCSCGCRQTH